VTIGSLPSSLVFIEEILSETTEIYFDGICCRFDKVLSCANRLPADNISILKTVMRNNISQILVG
jgi:hypothetical protein